MLSHKRKISNSDSNQELDPLGITLRYQ